MDGVKKKGHTKKGRTRDINCDEKESISHDSDNKLAREKKGRGEVQGALFLVVEKEE